MSRYVDADEFKKKMEQYLPEERELALKVLKKVPTADVVDKKRYDSLMKDTVIISEALNKYQAADYVEVVRCRACKYSKKIPLGYGCKMNYRLSTSGKWFCATGERREENAEVH